MLCGVARRLGEPSQSIVHASMFGCVSSAVRFVSVPAAARTHVAVSHLGSLSSCVCLYVILKFSSTHRYKEKATLARLASGNAARREHAPRSRVLSGHPPVRHLSIGDCEAHHLSLLVARTAPRRRPCGAGPKTSCRYGLACPAGGMQARPRRGSRRSDNAPAGKTGTKRRQHRRRSRLCLCRLRLREMRRRGGFAGEENARWSWRRAARQLIEEPCP